MTARDFVYWLQGYFELAGADPKGLDEKQTDLIRRHLALVFKHEIDPSYGDAAHQDALQAIHDGVQRAEAAAERAVRSADRSNPVVKC